MMLFTMLTGCRTNTSDADAGNGEYERNWEARDSP